MALPIGDFLGRFAKILRDGDEAREVVVQAAHAAGVRGLSIDAVVIRGTVATLKLSPAQKSEIALRQGRMLSELAKHPLTKHITVVR